VHQLYRQFIEAGEGIFGWSISVGEALQAGMKQQRYDMIAHATAEAIVIKRPLLPPPDGPQTKAPAGPEVSAFTRSKAPAGDVRCQKIVALRAGGHAAR